MTLERFNRLALSIGVEGLDILQNSSLITIVYDSPIVKFFALPLITAGIPVKLIGLIKTTRNEKLIDIPLDPGMSATSYEKALTNFNGPGTPVVGEEARLETYTSSLLLKGSTGIIDCTNSSRSKEIALKYARTNNIGLVSTSVIPGYGKLMFAHPDSDPKEGITMPGFSELEEAVFGEIGQGRILKSGAIATKNIIGMFMAGLAADVIVQYIIGKEECLTEPLFLKFGHGKNIFKPLGNDAPVYLDPRHFKGESILSLGSGAVASNTCFPWSFLPLERMDFLDLGFTKSSNIIRTLLLYNSVNEDKAVASAQRIQSITDQRTLSTGYVEEFTPDWLPERTYSALLDGFDNFYSRGLGYLLGLNTKTPVISASGRHDGFNTQVFVPNKTLCFDCMISLSEKAAEDEAARRESCERELTPQNTWLNMSVGAYAALSLANVLHPEIYGPLINGVVAYDPVIPDRLLMSDRPGVCTYDNGGGMIHKNA